MYDRPQLKTDYLGREKKKLTLKATMIQLDMGSQKMDAYAADDELSSEMGAYLKEHEHT